MKVDVHNRQVAKKFKAGINYKQYFYIENISKHSSVYHLKNGRCTTISLLIFNHSSAMTALNRDSNSAGVAVIHRSGGIICQKKSSCYKGEGRLKSIDNIILFIPIFINGTCMTHLQPYTDFAINLNRQAWQGDYQWYKLRSGLW